MGAGPRRGRGRVIRTVEFPTGPAPDAGGPGARDRCIKKFKEWWGPAELRDRLEEVAPYVAEMLGGSNGGIVNADRLAEMLYESVGPHFLRNIENDNKKRRTFLRAAMDAAIRNGDTTKENLLDAASGFSRTAITLDDAVYANATRKWCSALAHELGLPQTTADKEAVERPPPTEDVEPHSPLNPLYDYQYTTGLLIRGMLDGTHLDGGRPVKRRLIAVPTGSGKTRMVVETLIDWLNDGKPSEHERQRDSKFIVWVAQSTELCEQAVSSFRSVFETAGRRGTVLHLHRFWGQGGSLPSTDSLLDKRGVIVATIQSLGKVLRNDPDQLERLARLTSCIVVDEAHHALAQSYSDVLEKMGFNWSNRKKEISELGIVLIGLTATPFRGTGGDEEKARLARRFGAVHYPSIPYLGAEKNQRPHALVDCQPSAYAGTPVRILGARSYDRDGFIGDDGYEWEIEKTRRFIDLYRGGGDGDQEGGGDRWVYRARKNIVHVFGDPGEYRVTLTVTDNEGDAGSASAYIRIAEAPPGNGGGGGDEHRQKDLYEKLIKRGILCEVYHHVLRSDAITLTAADVEYMGQFGEFRKDTVKEIGRNPARNKIILEEIHRMKRDHGRSKILFFGCSVGHSRQVALMLKMLYGMRTAYVDSKTDSDTRSAAIESFRSGDLEVLCNFDVLTAGFDAPNIDCVFVGRPVRSTLLYTQMIGRGMRGTKSGGTEDVVLIDIDDNFQLSYGQDESLAKVGWMVYSEYWKTWGGGGGVRPGERGRAPPAPQRPSSEGAAQGPPGAAAPGDHAAGRAAGGAAAPALRGDCADESATEAEAAAGSGAKAASAPAAEPGRDRLEPSARRPAERRSGPRTASAIDDEFDFLRNKVYGHVPTSRQFATRAHPDAIAAVERLYGGYGGYLESKGLSARGDRLLEDVLYDNYFSLYSMSGAAPSAADLDARGRYAAEEYAECFGSHERFQAIADEIIGRMSKLDPGITKADLFRDYRRMRAELGHQPYFEEVRLLSQAGVEYYLGLFGSMADFGSAEEHDREAALQSVKADCRRLRGLLGVVPNARQVGEHSRSGALLRSLYPGMDEGRAYSEFMRDAGIGETPVQDLIPYETSSDMRRRTIQKFMELAASRRAGGATGRGDRGAAPAAGLGRDDILEILRGEDPAPYSEWFGSVEDFADFVARMLAEDGGDYAGHSAT